MRSFSLKGLVRDLETRAIKRALIEHDYNRARAAKALGLRRTTFVMKCKRYRIDIAPNPFRHEVLADCPHGAGAPREAYRLPRKNAATRYRCAICAREQRRYEYELARLDLKAQRRAREAAWTASAN